MKKIESLVESLKKDYTLICDHQETLKNSLVEVVKILAKIINYKHEKKDFYRLHIRTDDNQEYDVDDLLKQAEKYIEP